MLYIEMEKHDYILENHT